MGTLCIRNGHVLDPATGVDEIRDLWIADGNFMPADSTVDNPDKEIYATGMLVMPGFVDPHVHLREPGNEAAETIATGCAAALAAGYTSIIAMPNTTPAIDNPKLVGQVRDKAAALGNCCVYLMPAATMGRAGEALANLAAMADLRGVVGFTDDGMGVENAILARKVMEFCARHGEVVFSEHCEFRHLSDGGVMHPGRACKRAKLKGYPAEAETAMIKRDIQLCEETGGRVHFQHLSSARSVELIRDAKARGLKVSAEVTPHHLLLTDEDSATGGTNFKMNPPLRSEADRQALVEGLRQGVIDMIATDHAPHTTASKSRPFSEAPFGVIGMETAAAVIWTRLVRPGILTSLEMADRMSMAPAVSFGLRAGTLAAGQPADVTIFDPEAKWKVAAEQFRSLSRNCPFAGWDLQGRVAATIVGGEVRYGDDLC